MMKNIVVTGIGVITPLKPLQGLAEFWGALCSGEDAVKIMKPPLDLFEGEWPMAAVDMSLFRDHSRNEDKVGILAEEALAMAIRDSGLDISSKSFNDKAGLTVGTVLGNFLYKEVEMINSASAEPVDDKVGQAIIYNNSLSAIATNLAQKHCLNGPVLTVSTACASGTDSIGIAARKILTGQADIMFAGGVDVLSDLALAGFNSLQALTKDKPRPFDRNRDGLALGEGSAFVVLESEQHANHRKAAIYGKILGYASRADANHLTGPHREGRGLAAAMRAAISSAGIKLEDVGYINAHGTGTPYNDVMETKAIKCVFDELSYQIPVSSTKSMLGHSFGAAGVIEAICCLQAIKTKRIPPTINFQNRDADCDLNYVPNTAIDHDIQAAISLSAGFGGQNSVLVMAAA